MINKIINAAKWRIALPFTLYKWYKSDRKGIAPHFVKQKTVLKYKLKNKGNVFIETGTFMGEMVNAMKNKFKQVHSIELNPQFANNAQQRFSKYSNVKIWEGDSGVKIKEILDGINENIVFWLDGHCCIHEGKITSRASEDSPIVQEINYIIKHMKSKNLKHVILIDDARLFVGTDGYPEFEFFANFIKKEIGSSNVSIENDIIVIY